MTHTGDRVQAGRLGRSAGWGETKEAARVLTGTFPSSGPVPTPQDPVHSPSADTGVFPVLFRKGPPG